MKAFMDLLMPFLAGAIMLAAWGISLFFLRFWKKTRDRFFLFFAIAFLVLGIERVSIIFLPAEDLPSVFLLRLLAFLIFLVAILDKNRQG